MYITQPFLANRTEIFHGDSRDYYIIYRLVMRNHAFLKKYYFQRENGRGRQAGAKSRPKRWPTAQGRLFGLNVFS